jgi:nucleoside-diphosphate-sugar epimerase
MTNDITTLDQLEDAISEPSQSVTDALGRVQGDIMLLGAGGKIGPSLARMAKRASDAAGVGRKIIAVDTFPGPDQKSKLEALGIDAIKCDLLDRRELDALPDAPNVIFMIGMKFGATGQEALTWALNAYLPGMVCERFASSRIVAYSTGNVYGLTPVTLGGSVETDAPNPVGEYAMSALGRERIFEHFSRARGVPVGIIRLNYSNELRYGVLVDIARRVWAGEPVDVTMGNANVIWQGDANAMVLQSFERCASPAFVVNVAGPELVSVRRAAEQFGELMGKPVTITGSEAQDALLSNGQLGHKLFGYPRVSLQQMMAWQAAWIMRGGESLGKPTHFESREGKF